MPKKPAAPTSIATLLVADDPPDDAPIAAPYVLEMMRWCKAGDDWRFNRALAALWNHVVCYEEPVREWRDLARAPLGNCPGAVDGDELALFVALMIGVLVNFTDPPPRKRKRRAA